MLVEIAMSHGGLICRQCFAETSIENASAGSGADGAGESWMVCPNCGSDTFGI